MSGWLAPNKLMTTTGYEGLVAGVVPTAWMFTTQGTRHVVFQKWMGSDGFHFWELHADRHSDIWIPNDLTSSTNAFDTQNSPWQRIASSYVWSKQRSQHVIYQNDPFVDGHVHELWWTDGDGWNHHDLTKATNAPLAQPYWQPFGFETKYDHTQRVVYQGQDNHIHHLYMSDDRWHHEDITEQAGASPSSLVAGPTAYSFEGQETVHVLARTDDGHILEYYADQGPTGWQTRDLTTATGAPPANIRGGPVGAAVGYAFEGQRTQHVMYVNFADAHIIELWWDSTTGWHPYNDLTERLTHGVQRVSPLANRLSTPACYAFESSRLQPQATQHIFFTGYDGPEGYTESGNYVHELWWDATGWHYNSLSFASSLPPDADVVAFVDVEEGTQNVFYQGGRSPESYSLVELQWKP